MLGLVKVMVTFTDMARLGLAEGCVRVRFWVYG